MKNFFVLSLQQTKGNLPCSKDGHPIFLAKGSTPTVSKKANHIGVKFQFNVLDEAGATTTRPTTHRCTSTSMISPITNERLSIRSANQSAIPLNNKGRK